MDERKVPVVATADARRAARRRPFRDLAFWWAAIAALAACTKPAPTPRQATPAPGTAVTASASPSPTPATDGGAAPAPTVPPGASPASTPPLGDEDVQLTGPRVIISGRVGVSGGGPAGGATVSVQTQSYDRATRSMVSSPLATTTASADGRYRFNVSAAANGQNNTYFSATLVARKPGFAPRSENIYSQQGAASIGSRARAAAAADDDSPRVTDRPSKNFELEPAVALSGRVVGPDGAPVTSATVRIGYTAFVRGMVPNVDNVTTTGADGAFRFADLATGPVALTASDSKGRWAMASRTSAAPSENVELRFAGEGGRIEGNVFQLETGAPVLSATIRMWQAPEPGTQNSRALVGLPAPVTTDELGGFTIEHIMPGKYTLDAFKGEALRPAPDVGAPRSGDVGIPFEIAEGKTTSGLILRLYAGHTIIGTVSDKATSAPIEGAKIAAGYDPSMKKSVMAGADGAFRLSGVFAEQSNQTALFALKDGYSQPVPGVNRMQPDFVKLDPRRLEIVRDIEMAKTVTLRVTAKNEKGEPVAGAAVSLAGGDYEYGFRSQLKAATGDAATVRTDKDGRATLFAEPFLPCAVKVDSSGWPLAFSEALALDDRDRDVAVVVKKGGTLQGRVVDAQKSPIAGATVKATASMQVGRNTSNIPVGDAVSGGDGSFTIANAMPGSVKLGAEMKGFARSSPETVELAPGATKENIVLALRAGHFIAGKVTDGEGKPLAGASIHYYAQAEMENQGNAQTDGQGRYRIEDLAEFPYYVGASYQSLKPAQKPAVKVDSDNVDFVMTGEKEKDYTLVGKVVDAATGEAVKDFEVTHQNGAGRETVSLGVPQPGYFTMSGFRPNYYFSITITAAGYQPLNDTTSPFREGGSTKVEKTYKLGHGGSIVGRVVKRGTEEGISGVRVMVMTSGNAWEADNAPPAAMATTDDKGHFEFAKVAAGSHVLRFRPDAPLVEQTRTVEVREAQKEDMALVEIRTGGTLKGRVVRGATAGETPIAGATVRLTTNNSSQNSKMATSDANGAFEFPNLVPSGYTALVDIAANSGTPTAGTDIPKGVSTYVNIADGNTQDIVLRIGSGAVRGTVTQRGKPVAGASVNASGQGNSTTVSDADGKYSLQGLAAGKWTLSANVWDGSNSRMARATVDLEDGQEVVKDIVVTSGKLKGKVLDREGKPVEGANIWALSVEPKGFNQAVQTGSDGTYNVSNLMAGSYSAWARKPKMGQTVKVTVRIPDGEDATLDFVLAGRDPNAGTVISTALRLADGKPIPKAWCYLRLGGPDGEQYDDGSTRGDDGVMTIEGVPPGTYSIEVSGWGFSVAKHEGVEVKAGSPVRFDDVLYDAGSFDWKFTNATGAPAAGVAVKLEPADASSIETRHSGQTNPQGVWTTRGLMPGRYTAIATPPGRDPISETITIIAHQGTSKTTKLP